MPLVLEIEHLLGVAFAAIGPDSAAPDWPPQPDRVFSALVAAWAARGERPEERAALAWLEKQDPPRIEASPAEARPAPTTFVPPTDPETKSVGDKGVLPALRRRQPRRFPAALPHDPIVRLVWPDVADAPLEALDAVARDVAYVGHSSSLTRCRFVAEHAPAREGRPARRRIYPGRLQELEAAFRARRRPSPGDAVPPAGAAPDKRAAAFSADWLTLEIVAGGLDLRAAAPAAKALRDTIMSGYGMGGLPVPEWVSGHQPDGAPSREPHLASVPLAFAGFAHADGQLMGFALVPPRGRDGLLEDDGFRKALHRVSEKGEDGRRRFRLTLGRAGTLDLAVALETERASLDPRRYTRASRQWATLTPLVLDRHLKAEKRAELQAEIEGLVADACVRIGLPRPVRVVADKHAAVAGAPSAYPSGKAPRWTGWRVPEALRSRRLTHAVIAFEEPVAGPVLIGAGRFCGLGLCLPLDRAREP